MRIINVVDSQYIKTLLKKYYETSNIDYIFVDPYEDILNSVKSSKSEIILLQTVYDKKKLNDLMTELLENLDIYRDLNAIVLLDNRSDVSTELVDLSHIEKVVTIPIEEILDKLKYVIFKVTKETEFNQRLVTTIENKRTILFVDDNKFVHHFIDNTFSNTNYQIIHAYDGEEGFKLYKEHKPSLVLTDLEMPKTNGVELCKKIKDDDLGKYIPTIILSGVENPIDIEKAYNLGATDYLVKPIKAEELINKVNDCFTEFSKKSQEKVLIVDDSRMIREILRHGIIKSGMAAMTAGNGEEALRIIELEMPDVIITDLNMPIMNGYELCSRIKSNPKTEHINVIMVSSKSAPYDMKKGEKMGVSKYFVKPFDVEKVVLEIEHMLLEKYKIYKKEYEFMFYSIQALIQALEERDKYTRGHTDRVTQYAIKLAKYMNLNSNLIENIRIASSLHDIGKIGIRDEILYKPGRLTKEEFLIVQEHAQKGAEILKPIVSLKDVIPLILYHHEKWDGTGYPAQLKGERIPLGARIIAVADAFDAMTSDRPYHIKKSTREALEVIKANIGFQFCPVSGQAFINMIEMIEEDVIS